MAAVNPYLSYTEAHRPDLIELLRRLVECESPSDSPDAVDRFVDLLISETSDIADATTIHAPGFGRHLRLVFRTGNEQRGSTGQLLALGHSDTVWPIGTVRDMPFREADGRLWGPGVLDMKGGIVCFLYAMRALIELGVRLSKRVVLLLVSDEEVGSPTSRAVTEAEARQSDCVFVLEPGTGLAGKLKTARKGIGRYELLVKGRASHAGVDFEDGASAVLEIARQIPVIAGFTDLSKGTTVNPGVIRGGARSNVVASEAYAEIDVRVRTLDEWNRIDTGMRSLKSFDPRCQLRIDGALNRPPMVRSEAIARLFSIAEDVARTLDMSIEESETGGGSDGNFTAALGIPTLDGLGAVGEGAHAATESVIIGTFSDRISLLAGLVVASQT
jgi:glutamate carboxypeptidase